MSEPPNISQFWRQYPHKVLLAFGQEENKEEIINSELAYMTIAAGRKIYQDQRIIDRAIADNTFYRNKILISTFEYAKKNRSAVHLIGLLDNGLYSQINHLTALLELANRMNFKNVYLDLISTTSESVQTTDYLTQIQRKIDEVGLGQITSIVGKNFAMTNNLNSLVKVSQMIIDGNADKADTVEWATKTAHKKGLSDSEIEPTLIRTPEGIITLRANDACIFFNFSSSLIKKYARILIDPQFRLPRWQAKIIPGVEVTTLTKYFKTLNTQIAFARPLLNETLAEVFAKYQKSNLRIGEQVKAEHLTTSFNGGREDPFSYEERNIIPSLKPTDFHRHPELSGAKITELTKSAIASKKYDFICLNFPNPDILAHGGNITAATKAVKAVDNFVGQIVEANTEGAIIVVGDHGIVEEMKGPRTRHTANPVPFILIAKDRKRDLLRGALTIHYSTLAKLIGIKENLTDVAPTILELMNLPKPTAMTGHSLLNKLD